MRSYQYTSLESVSMLTGLEHKTVRKKLIYTSLLVTGLAILISLIVSIVDDISNARANTTTQLMKLADVVAIDSANHILVNDKNKTIESLALLQVDSNIFYAEIFDRSQNVLAIYTSAPDEETSRNHLFSFFTTLEVERNIQLNDLVLGSVLIKTNLGHVWSTLATQWLMKLALLSVIFLFSYLILRKTSSYVLDPIQRLAKAINNIIDSGDYSLRVEKTSVDELGELTTDFNLMLSHIQDRDNQLKQSNEALAQVQEPIVLRNVDLNCEYVNPAFTEMFGYTLDELKGTDFSLEVENRMGSRLEKGLTQSQVYELAKKEGVYRGEANRQAKDGRILPLQRHISPVKDSNGEVKGYVTVLSDISAQKNAEEQIWRQANYDNLTGLPNRLMFTERLKHQMTALKSSKSSLALMFLDLDHFKEINDTLGHDMGDVLLKEASKRILSCVRGSDSVGYLESESVARLGGDEFTIILSEIKGIRDADIVANRVLEKLAEPFQLAKEVVHISASIGIVEAHPGDIIDTDTLIKHADIAMYDAKQKGRNRFSRFSKKMLIEAQKRRRLINDIHKALKHDEFHLVFQPIVDMKTNIISKAEALIRWDHPKEGLINPADFITVAEDAGLIEGIGNWVFEETAKQVKEWRKTLHKDFQISVNKSPVQLHSIDDEKTGWAESLKALDLPGESVIVEITEGVFLQQNTIVRKKLQQYREAGMQISLDDFGTGYSSLSYLLKFEIDYIKIDKSFVNNLTINRQDLILCEAMIVMAHKLGIKVVAEGIETQAQMSALLEAGCDYAQGYLTSKPLKPEAFEELHKSHSLGSYMESA